MCDGCKCKSLLARRHITITDRRRYVIKVLTQANTSLTPPEILKGVRNIHRMNKVTLYRILNLLEEKEILRSIPTSTGVTRYALIDPLDKGNQNLPPQFICRKCKTIVPAPLSDWNTLVQKRLPAKFSGPFELTIEGICPECRKEQYD